MKTTKTIQLADKPILVFGGPYSNLHALKALKNVAENEGFEPNQIICTGDIVGYCAHPEESVQFVSDWGIHAIAGNVELQLREGAEDCGCEFNEGSRCDLFSLQWYPYAQSQMSEASLAFLQTIPDHLSFSWAGKKWAVVHGDAFETAGYVFKSTNWEEKLKTTDHLQVDGILAGHSGLPFFDRQSEKAWINAGVIGMPANDGDTRVWYAILDPANPFVPSFQQLHYDSQAASDAMKERGLPASYAQTLLDGLWDNMEILPEIERGLRGVGISF